MTWKWPIRVSSLNIMSSCIYIILTLFVHLTCASAQEVKASHEGNVVVDGVVLADIHQRLINNEEFFSAAGELDADIIMLADHFNTLGLDDSDPRVIFLLGIFLESDHTSRGLPQDFFSAPAAVLNFRLFERLRDSSSPDELRVLFWLMTRPSIGVPFDPKLIFATGVKLGESGDLFYYELLSTMVMEGVVYPRDAALAEMLLSKAKGQSAASVRNGNDIDGEKYWREGLINWAQLHKSEGEPSTPPQTLEKPDMLEPGIPNDSLNSDQP